MMTKDQIAELRAKTVKSATVGNPLADVVVECLDAIEELQIKSDFDDVAFERVKAERGQLQSRVQDLEKDRAKLFSIVVSVHDHLCCGDSLRRMIDEVRREQDHYLPTLADVQSAMKGTCEH